MPLISDCLPTRYSMYLHAILMNKKSNVKKTTFATSSRV